MPRPSALKAKVRGSRKVCVSTSSWSNPSKEATALLALPAGIYDYCRIDRRPSRDLRGRQAAAAAARTIAWSTADSASAHRIPCRNRRDFADATEWSSLSKLSRTCADCAFPTRCQGGQAHVQHLPACPNHDPAHDPAGNASKRTSFGPQVFGVQHRPKIRNLASEI